MSYVRTYTNTRQKSPKTLNFGRFFVMSEQILTIKALMERYNCSKPTLYRQMRDGNFPKGISLGKLRRWPLSQIEAWEKAGTKE